MDTLSRQEQLEYLGDTIQAWVEWEKTFKGEMLINKAKSLHQIVCKIILTNEVIVKRIKDPDENF